MKIIVIGAGPSGLMCSYKLKEKGFDVLLLEKNEKVAKKVYITGKGRCNITNNCSKEDFFSNVVNNPKFLFSAYNNFTSQDTMEFFESRGVKLIVERGNRVYPASYNPHDIVSCLYNACKESGVDIKLNEPVLSINKKDNYFVVVTKKNTYHADKLVIATGGKSYAHTGSTGDGYKFAQHFGHTIIEPVPALITLRIKEEIPANLYRFTFKNVSSFIPPSILISVLYPFSFISFFSTSSLYKTLSMKVCPDAPGTTLIISTKSTSFRRGNISLTLVSGLIAIPHLIPLFLIWLITSNGFFTAS